MKTRSTQSSSSSSKKKGPRPTLKQTLSISKKRKKDVVSPSKYNDKNLYDTNSLGDKNERYAVGADDTIEGLLKTIMETSDLSFPKS